MKHTSDTLELFFARSIQEAKELGRLKQILEYLSHSFIQAPTRLKIDTNGTRNISGFGDRKILDAVRSAKHFVHLLDGEFEVMKLYFFDEEITLFLRIPSTAAAHLPVSALRSLFLDIAISLRPSFASAHFDRASQDLATEQYAYQRRTFHSSGLYWLNFFGPEEEEAQGGPALADNPYAQVTRLQHGLVLQVCDDPFEAASPEGIERLVAATKAMPPIQQDEPVEDPDSEFIQIGQIQAEYNSREQQLTLSMVTRMEEKPISEHEAEAIASLPERGGLDVKKIAVNFFSREIARQNRDRLAKHGIAARYWDEEQRDYAEI